MVQLAITVAGAFAVVLGILHFGFPRRFGFAELLGGAGPLPPIFRLGPYRNQLSRSDVLGIVYVMNHSASFAILSLGVFDLCISQWHGAMPGKLVSAWAALFWWLRASVQLHLGRRPGDCFVMAVFALLGLVQLLPIFGD